MKTLGTLILFLFVSLGLICSKNKSEMAINGLQATYQGLNEKQEFEFSDFDGNIIAFNDLYNFSKHDLYEEIYVGQNFEILWQERFPSFEEEVELYGTNKIKSIIRLKMLN